MVAARVTAHLQATGKTLRGGRQIVARSHIANAENPRSLEWGLRSLIIETLEGRTLQRAITYVIVDSGATTGSHGASMTA